MEAFESFVALALETEGLVVSEALKFPVAQQTSSGLQTHGYEVDLVGARADRLVLASVKSLFGSAGVAADHVAGNSANPSFNKRYALLNNTSVRDTVVQAAASRFGYTLDQVELRLYVGKFAGTKEGKHEKAVRQWCAAQRRHWPNQRDRGHRGSHSSPSCSGKEAISRQRRPGRDEGAGSSRRARRPGTAAVT